MEFARDSGPLLGDSRPRCGVALPLESKRALLEARDLATVGPDRVSDQPGGKRYDRLNSGNPADQPGQAERDSGHNARYEDQGQGPDPTPAVGSGRVGANQQGGEQ